MRKFWMAGAVLAGIALGWIVMYGGSGAADPNNQNMVSEGQKLYAVHCAQCHGADLQGEPDWQNRRPSGELPAPPHDQTGHTWHHPDEHLFAVTKYGIARFAPADYKSNMPGFIGKLTDRQINAVLAFIKSRWPRDIRERQDALNRRS